VGKGACPAASEGSLQCSKSRPPPLVSETKPCRSQPSRSTETAAGEQCFHRHRHHRCRHFSPGPACHPTPLSALALRKRDGGRCRARGGTSPAAGQRRWRKRLECQHLRTARRSKSETIRTTAEKFLPTHRRCLGRQRHHQPLNSLLLQRRK
jgi:hypothetical protein